MLARAKFSHQLDSINVLLAGIEEIAVTVTPVHSITVSTDDEDNRLLECAEAAQADFLVTGNRKHFPTFLHRTRIVTAREFLTELGF